MLPFLTHAGYSTCPLLHCTDSADSGVEGDRSNPSLHTKSIKSPCKTFPAYFHFTSTWFLSMSSSLTEHGSARHSAPFRLRPPGDCESDAVPKQRQGQAPTATLDIRHLSRLDLLQHVQDGALTFHYNQIGLYTSYHLHDTLNGDD